MKNFILDFSRHEALEQRALAVTQKSVTYTLHSEGGGAEEVQINWNDDLFRQLTAVAGSSVDPAAVQELGNTLRQLLPVKTRTAMERVLKEAIGADEPVRITIRSTADEIYHLPWDLLTRETGPHLCMHPRVLLRYAAPHRPSAAEQPTPRPPGGRILFAWAAPNSEIPFDKQRDAITRACQRAGFPFDPRRDVLGRASLSSLKRALGEDPPVNILHILCHGATRTDDDVTFGLALHADESPDERRVVDARQIEQLLSPHAGQLRLVFLSACQSAHGGALGNHLGSPALSIFNGGIQSVIASRFVLSQDASVVYTESFYGELLGRPASLEDAFVKARQDVLQDREKLAWASMRLYAQPEDGDDTRPVILRPYRGLLAFEPEHARFFFGRDAEIQETIQDLEALAEAKKERFLLVAGASGTGKSSVVLGGVVPALVRAQEASKEDPALTALRHTLNSLDATLRQRAADPLLLQARELLQRRLNGLVAMRGTAWQAEIMRPGMHPLESLDAALKRRDPQRRFLLVVDQLEEIFTHTDDLALRTEFVRKLWQASREPDGIFCIATIRVDFLGRCGEIVLDDAQKLRLDSIAYDEAYRVFVAQMGKDALRKTIEGPAHKVGLLLENGLTEQMLGEVEGEPGALPLLEYMLDLLWQRREGPKLSLKAYHELGGVIGALERKADTVVTSLTADEQALARRIMTKLVGLGQAGAGDTRLRVSLPALRARLSQTDAVPFDKVVARLVEERLLVQSGDQSQTTLEVAHEALIRKWKTLRSWLLADRDKLIEVRKMEDLVSGCQGRLHGSQIGYARAVIDQYPDDVSPQAKWTVAESERIANESLAAERRKAEEVRQRLLAIDVEKGRQLLLAGDPVRALLWLNRAYQGDSTSAILPYLMAQCMPLLDCSTKELGEPQRTQNLALKPDGSQLLSVVDLRASASSDFRLWDVDSGKLLYQRQLPGTVVGASFGADGPLVVVQEEAKIVLWNLTANLQQAVIAESQKIANVRLSPQGEILVTWTNDDPTAKLWDAKTGKHVKTLAGNVLRDPDAAPSAAASPDRAPAQPLDINEAIASIAFSADGMLMASSHFTQEVRVWNLQAATLTATCRLNLPANNLALSPDGSKLLTAFDGGNCQIWNVQSGQLEARLAGHTKHFFSADYIPSSRHLITASYDDTVKLWDISSQRLLTSVRVRGALRAVSRIGPRTCRIAVCRTNGRASLSDVRLGHEVAVLGDQQYPIAQAAFSPDGRQILTGALGGLRFWETVSGACLGPNQAARYAGAWGPWGLRAVVGAASAIELWDLDSQKKVADLMETTGAPRFIDFSAGGRLLLVLDAECRGRVFDAQTGALLLALPVLPTRLESMGIWGERLLLAAYSSHNEVWDLQSGTRLFELADQILATCLLADGLLVVCKAENKLWLMNVTTGNRLPLGEQFDKRSAAFTDDCRLLIVTSEDRTATLWDVDSGKLLISLEGHRAALLRCCFSPDGRLVATGSMDGAVLVWDVRSGLLLYSFAAHEDAVIQLVFSPDSCRLFSRSACGSAKLWDVHAETRDKAALNALVEERLPFCFDGEAVVAKDKE